MRPSRAAVAVAIAAGGAGPADVSATRAAVCAAVDADPVRDPGTSASWVTRVR